MLNNSLAGLIGYIQKAYDIERHINQIQPGLMILKASKPELKTGLFQCYLYH
jgi:hypothetical protein